MSALLRYIFTNPKRGDFNLNDEKVYLIMDEEQSRKAERILKEQETLFVDCEGYHFGNNDQELGAIQIAIPSGECFVFYVTRYDGCLGFLKPLLESDEVQKVFHDCSGDSSVLYAKGIWLNNVDDTQIVHKVIQSNKHCEPINKATGPALHELYQDYCYGEIPKRSSSQKKSKKTYGEIRWIRRYEPDEDMIKKAAVDVLALRMIFNAQENHPSFFRDLGYKCLVEKQLRRKVRYSGLHQTFEYEAASHTSDESDSDTEICTDMAAMNPVARSPRNTQTSSTNWGWLAVGAAAAITVGAIAASAAERRQEEERRRNLLQQSENSSEKNKQKQDECTIS